jgi:hypothetical protein
MSEQQTINIDGKDYDLASLSQPCKELLVRAQNGQNALAVMGTTLELARIGQEVINIDLRKLLPTEDDETDVAEGELIQ